MDNRALAISILQRARDILTARLVERVIEAGEEIIEDALGNSYSSEIENIHEQVALRLTHVNAMLAALPPTAVKGMPAVASSAPGKALGESIAAGELPPPDADAAPRGTAASADRAAAITPPDAASFQAFVQQVTAGDIDSAGATLAVLLEVTPIRGRGCAETFADHLAGEPDFLPKAMRLRGELQSGTINAALMLLWECFGLQGMESIGALQALKARLAGRHDGPQLSINDERSDA